MRFKWGRWSLPDVRDLEPVLAVSLSFTKVVRGELEEHVSGMSPRPESRRERVLRPELLQKTCEQPLLAGKQRTGLRAKAFI